MTATFEGLTAKLDAIAFVRDEAGAPRDQAPAWLRAVQTADSDELRLLLAASVHTAAELVRRNPRGTALPSITLLALADQIGAARLRLKPESRTSRVAATSRRRPRWRTACAHLGGWLTRLGSAR